MRGPLLPILLRSRPCSMSRNETVGGAKSIHALIRSTTILLPSLIMKAKRLFWPSPQRPGREAQRGRRAVESCCSHKVYPDEGLP